MASRSPQADRKASAGSPEDQKQDRGREDSSPTKRKSSSTVDEGAQNIPEDRDAGGKKKRRKVNHACVYCRRSHMTCDQQRPCERCVKRDIGHLCHDEVNVGKRNKSDVGITDIVPASEDGLQNGMSAVPAGITHNGTYPAAADAGDVNMSSARNGRDSAGGNMAEGPVLAQPTPVSPSQLQQRPNSSIVNTQNAQQQAFNWADSAVQNQFQDMHHLHPNYMFNNAEVTNEYNLLNDFLSTSLLDDGALYSSDDAQALLSDPLLSTSSINALTAGFPNMTNPQGNQQQQPQAQLQQTFQAKAGEEISRPGSAFPTTEQSRNTFYMTAADPAGLSSAEDRLHKLLKAKYDAGMLKPFNYVRGYARLNTYMSAHLSRPSAIRILRQLDRFRPKFREAMQGLSDMQLVLVEMWFERSLMEYDRVFAAMAIPACCWRRTGEIFRGNREMAELIGVDWERLRDGRLAIHEIIAEESLVSYWEKFGAIAFDQSQKAILTSCSLKRFKNGEAGVGGNVSAGASERGGIELPVGIKDDDTLPTEIVKCCFSFTIRRDTHNIPSLIVGNFIPVREKKR